jgi:hypothetical protein
VTSPPWSSPPRAEGLPSDASQTTTAVIAGQGERGDPEALRAEHERARKAPLPPLLGLDSGSRTRLGVVFSGIAFGCSCSRLWKCR